MNYKFKTTDFYMYDDYHYVEDSKGNEFPFFVKGNIIYVPEIPTFSIRLVIKSFLDFLKIDNPSYIFDHLYSSELKYSDLYADVNLDNYKFKIYFYNYKTLSYDIYGIEDL